jgi:stress response protein SCP2
MLADINHDGFLNPIDIVYYGMKTRPGVRLLGDNRTGRGSGDDETILVDLYSVDSKVEVLAFTVSIYRCAHPPLATF